MKKLIDVGAYSLMAGLAAMLAGCASEKIMVDYTMPARKVTDVSKIDVLKVNVEANVKGDLAGDKARNAALVRQMISDRLYKTGYFRITDDFWGSDEGADNLAQVLKVAEESGHGYASYSSGGNVSASELCPKCGTICPDHKNKPQGMKVKAQLDVVVDLELNSEAKTTDETFSLATTPWVQAKIKEGMPPTSAPDLASVQTRTETHSVTKYYTQTKGTITAKISGIDGDDAPVEYENTFDIGGEQPVACDRQPTQLKAFAAAVAPAVAEIVADIAPGKQTRELVAIEGGDERVVTLLNATAFGEAADFVKELGRAGKAVGPDYENLGLAYEAMGQLEKALKTFKKVLKMNPGKPSATAKAAVARVEKALAGAAAVAASGQGNTDTKFTK